MPAHRIILVPATLAMMDAAVERSPALATQLDAAVAEGWEGFPEALPRLREAIERAPSSSWGTMLFLLEEPRTLVGMGGYKGAPSAAGLVEIGYAIAPAYQGRGLATTAARALVERAFADPRVTAVTAHTLGSPGPSTRVLEKVGFTRSGEEGDPEHGPIWAWTVRRGDLTL